MTSLNLRRLLLTHLIQQASSDLDEMLGLYPKIRRSLRGRTSCGGFLDEASFFTATTSQIHPDKTSHIPRYLSLDEDYSMRGTEFMRRARDYRKRGDEKAAKDCEKKALKKFKRAFDMRYMGFYYPDPFA